MDDSLEIIKSYLRLLKWFLFVVMQFPLDCITLDVY